jgi:hypothetical protein
MEGQSSFELNSIYFYLIAEMEGQSSFKLNSIYSIFYLVAEMEGQSSGTENIQREQNR